MSVRPQNKARIALVTVCVMLANAVAAQDTDGTGAFALQCETFCSTEKLRTANARLSWADPRVRLILMSNSLDAASSDLGEEIETTVFKNGFSEGLHASFPTTLDGQEMAPRLSAEVADAKLRAFQMMLVGVRRPTIEGRSLEALRGGNPESVETSAILEGLEPGLTYYWRVRVQMPGGVEVSRTVACVAPVCPADLQSGDE